MGFQSCCGKSFLGLCCVHFITFILQWESISFFLVHNLMLSFVVSPMCHLRVLLWVLYFLNFYFILPFYHWEIWILFLFCRYRSKIPVLWAVCKCGLRSLRFRYRTWKFDNIGKFILLMCFNYKSTLNHSVCWKYLKWTCI